eukprot:jgi/Botrbrau1/20167/Bobra.0173s0065.1
MMKQGFLNLARARYSMGPTKVCAAQLPSKMTASCRLEVCQEEGLPFRNIVASGKPGRASHQPSNVLSSSHTDKGEITSAGVTENGRLSHSSGYSSLIDDLARKFDCQELADDEECSKGTKDDPLRWFGSMVSPQLREAQRDFKAALQLLLHLANNKHHLVKALDEVNGAHITEAKIEE